MAATINSNSNSNSNSHNNSNSNRLYSMLLAGSSFKMMAREASECVVHGVVLITPFIIYFFSPLSL